MVDCTDENETKLRIQRYSQVLMDNQTFENQFGFLPVVDEQLKKAEEVILKMKNPKNKLD